MCFEECKDEENYSASKLIALSVLLGTGLKEEKAEIIYKNCESITAGQIEKSRFCEFLNDLLHVSIKAIPNVGIGKGKKFVQKEEIISYADVLKVSSATAASQITNVIFSDVESVDKETFIAAF
jgi:hypothetical protein